MILENFEIENEFPEIFHLNLGMSGGAWKAASRLSDSLNRFGINSHIINISEFENSRDRNFYRIGSKIDYEIYKSRDTPSTTSLFSSWGASRLLERALERIHNRSIINLHWIPGTLSPHIFEMLVNKKVIFTLHDMRYLTGFCHHAGECKRFETSCRSCPQAPRILQDYIESKYSRYREYFKKLESAAIVAPSDWLKNLCLASRIIPDRNIHKIYNPIPDSIFNLHQKQEIRNSNSPFKVCIYGAQNPLKGGKVALEALSKLNSSYGLDFELFVLGVLHKGYPNLKQTAINEISDDFKFAQFLSTMDLLFHFSTVENSPNLIREAQALGVRVIASDVGGSAELIYNENSGLVTDPSNLKQIAEFITDLEKQGSRSFDFNKVFKYPDHFSEKFLISEYLRVYKTLIKI